MLGSLHNNNLKDYRFKTKNKQVRNRKYKFKTERA